MCGGPEQLNNNSNAACSDGGISSSFEVASGSPGSKEGDCYADSVGHVSYLLELAAGNDLEGFQQAVKEHKVNVKGVGSWYGRLSGTALMVWEHRTPAMIASLYGSVDVLKYILATCGAVEDINMKCGSDLSTALHCAAAGGSARALETVILLLDFGADLNTLDAQGRRPADVIAEFPRLPHLKQELKALLEVNSSSTDLLDDEREHAMLFFAEAGKKEFMGINRKVDVLSTVATSNSSFSSCGGSPFSSPSPSSSPKALDTAAGKVSEFGNEKVKEYFVDPTIPDIKNSLYTTDEFRMFSFKVRPCSRAYSHDWTECPFVHPGENARRRDPRRYHYSCVPCPEFRKGACRRGDACEYAHGVFECWLHPAQYRTRLCKDGTHCTRRVCFFAHTSDELRPLYVSSGSAIPCLKTSSLSLDMVALSPPLCPGSPSSALLTNAFSSSAAQVNYSTPPMSPALSPANSLAGATWSPSNVPALHLPGASHHVSRLRASLNARDLALEEFGRASEFEGQLVNETAPFSSHALCTQARLNAAVAATSSSRYRNLGLTVSPTNLEELFTSDMVSSPRSFMQDASLIQMEAQMTSQKSSPLQSNMQANLGSPRFVSVSDQYLQFQQALSIESQLQRSPSMLSPKQMPSHTLGTLGRMSALGGGLDADIQSCNLPPSVIAARAAFAQRDKKSHSSRDLGAGSALSDWGSPTGKPEWGVQREDLSKFRKSASFGFQRSEEPDLLWVQTPVKEPVEADKGLSLFSKNDSISGSRESLDYASLGSWMENMQLDEIVA